MTAKKNRISIFGKTFHVTKAGQTIPLGKKNNYFTKCMHDQLKDKQSTGENLSKSEIDANKNRFKSAVSTCKGKK